MEIISEHMVTIICGETGSGKTTQVPQFLYEAGYTSDGFMIGITEPRRVAAISMSKRVAKELNMSESEVSYQIRYEGNVTPSTKIKFMTDGVLLKEIQNDFLLNKYRAVIIDEAHERSVYTDILIGLLSRIVTLRHKKENPLKLVIMSATLRVEDFRDNSLLFPTPPPVIKIDARQFPVSVHFNKVTEDDYLNEAYKKICKVHRKLPAGGILVFVTGKQEVHTLCKQLQRTFPALPQKPDVRSQETEDEKTEKSKASEPEISSNDADNVLPEIKLDSYSALPMDEQAELGVDDDSDLETEDADLESRAGNKLFDFEQRAADLQLPLHVLPLYSLLSTKRQAKVFDPPPEGTRLCIIATNVAETSLTIPNIKYVVDTGMTKNKYYDKVTGVSTFRVAFTSQASANQRAGRAGRTGPGHCYRLFSSSVFNDEFEKFSPPEIISRPVDDLVLQMKAMGIDKVINFPYPTPPAEETVIAAQDLLIKLGALTVTNPSLLKVKASKLSTKITDLGKTMSMFPVAPRYAKMLSLAQQQSLLEFVIAIVSACSVQELFIEGSLTAGMEGHDLSQQLQRVTKQKALWSGQGQSLLLGDAMVYLKAVGAAEFSGCTPEFCERHGLRYKAMSEIRKLRVQLTNIVNSVLPSAKICVNPKMSPPTEAQAKLLRQIMLSGLGDRVARINVTPVGADADTKKKMRHSYQCTSVDGLTYVHPGSVLHRKNLEYITYQDIVEANNKVYLRGVTAIEVEWLPKFVVDRCNLSEPLDEPPPSFDNKKGVVFCHVTSTFGPHVWQIPAVEIEFPKKIERYRWFACFLLQGLVVASMKSIAKPLLASPTIMVKSWARLQPRTESLLRALTTKSISTRSALITEWQQNPTYLLKEILEWIPEASHEQIKQTWPPS